MEGRDPAEAFGILHMMMAQEFFLKRLEAGLLKVNSSLTGLDRDLLTTTIPLDPKSPTPEQMAEAIKLWNDFDERLKSAGTDLQSWNQRMINALEAEFRGSPNRDQWYRNHNSLVGESRWFLSQIVQQWSAVFHQSRGPTTTTRTGCLGILVTLAVAAACALLAL